MKRKTDRPFVVRLDWLFLILLLILMGGVGVLVGQSLVARPQTDVTRLPTVVPDVPPIRVTTADRVTATPTYPPPPPEPREPVPVRPTGIPQACEHTCVDVLFLLDSTGSMGEEIEQLQNNLTVIAGEIDALPGQLDVRYGLVAYRDRADEYITQLHDFVRDVGVFQAHLNQVTAGGGGDEPEALNQALHDSLHRLSWRGDDTIKLVFLVADAPPHLDYPDDVPYPDSLQYATQQGIKIHPIASGGLSPAGEFIFRQIAQVTIGHFVFLTYDDGSLAVDGSKPPGDTREDLSVGEPEDEQGTGDYSVNQLDDLVLRLITDEIAALTTPVTVSGSRTDTDDETAILCQPQRREPPANAPTRIPDQNGFNNNSVVDPHIALCLTDESVQVGESFSIVAEAYDPGMPRHWLTLQDENGNRMTVALDSDQNNGSLPQLTVLDVTQDGWNLVVRLRAEQPGNLQLSASASGEIHYGYPGPATWSHAESGMLTLTISDN